MAARSRLVAERMRTSTGTGRLSPTRSITRSSSTRSSLTWVSAGKSPISSRKMVPPEAASNRPARAWCAPVKAPRTWPNSSLSKRASLRAAQLTLTYGPSRRGLRSCTARAASSLPVPDSPSSSRGASEPAALSSRSKNRCMGGLTPTIPWKVSRLSNSRRKASMVVSRSSRPLRSVIVSTAPITRPLASRSTEAFLSTCTSVPSRRTRLQRWRVSRPFANNEHQCGPSGARSSRQEAQLSAPQERPTRSCAPNPVISARAWFTETMVPDGSTIITPSWMVSTTVFQLAESSSVCMAVSCSNVNTCCLTPLNTCCRSGQAGAHRATGAAPRQQASNR